MNVIARKVILLIMLSIVYGCADDDGIERGEGEGYYNGIKCPRLLLEEFDDCRYGGDDIDGTYVATAFDESVAEFCQSSCNEVYRVIAYKDKYSQDLSLLRGVRKAQNIELAGLRELDSLRGLEDLEEVEKSLTIVSAAKLTDLEALNGLRVVGNVLDFRNLPGLKDLKGLEGLRRTRVFRSADNENLEDITALENAENIDILDFTNNPKLPACQAEALRDQFGVTGEDYSAEGLGSGVCE